MSEGLLRVRNKAKENKSLVFTELMHHATPELFMECYRTLNKRAAAGIDRQSWEDYGQGNLEDKLADLRNRMFSGRYRALPSRRVYIPKANGKLRALGIAAIEDKIAQNVIRTILEQVYEPTFRGFSYGFRPKRSCHDALDALFHCIRAGKVSWVLDADLKGYFDSIPHDKLIGVLKQRIGDPRIFKLIQKWLKAGIMENGEVSISEFGTIQGGVISPLLANVYLHYALDDWLVQKRLRNYGIGEISIVRYADDFIICFQYRWVAEKFLNQLRERLGRFGLELQTEKTRLIEFGRFAIRDRRARGDRKPETFDFLGFTHICSKTKNGKFTIRRIISSKKLCKKLQDTKEKIRRRMHRDVEETLDWLKSLLRGYYQYFAVPGNLSKLRAFRHHIGMYLFKILRRRSHKAYRTITWDWYNSHVDAVLPRPKLCHEPPDERFRRKWKLC